MSLALYKGKHKVISTLFKYLFLYDAFAYLENTELTHY